MVVRLVVIGLCALLAGAGALQGALGGASSAAAPGAPLLAWSAFAAAVLACALACHSALALRRGAGALVAALAELEQDLDAPVRRPPLAELRRIASAVERLATRLSRVRRRREEHDQAERARARRAGVAHVLAGVVRAMRPRLAALALRTELAPRSAIVPRPERSTPEAGAALGEAAHDVAALATLAEALALVAGTRVVSPAPAQLETLCAERIAAIAARAATRSLRVALSGSARANVDPAALARALDALLENACTAAPRGSTIDVAIAVAAGARALRVTVSDDGPGVAPDLEPRLFEPFFSTQGERAGLGLATARALAEAHGGSLTYERTTNRTHFVLRLPVVPAAPGD